MNIDTQLLEDQIDFLYSYPWREKEMPQEIEGVLNLLGAILDKETRR